MNRRVKHRLRTSKFAKASRPARATVVESLEARQLLSVTNVAPASAIPFQRFVIDGSSGGSDVLEKALGDINGDGKQDAVIGYGSTGLAWYAFPASGNPSDTWVKHSIVSSGTAYEQVLVADINADGAMDVVASYQSQVIWFENPKGHGGNPATDPWTQHLVGNGTGHEMYLTDIDGDGKLDIVTNDVLFFQNSSTSWTRVVGPQYNRTQRGTTMFDSGSGLGAVDMAGTGEGPNYSLVWWENPRDHGGNARTDTWIPHVFGPTYWAKDGNGVSFASIDVNGDGRADIVSAEGENPNNVRIGPGLLWWEAPADRRNGTWVSHVIDSSVEFCHILPVADMNGDGLPDLLIFEQDQSDQTREMIVFNVGGTGQNWQEQVLGKIGGHNEAYGDITGDGNMDILNAPHGFYSGFHPIEVFMNQIKPLGIVRPTINSQPTPQNTSVGGSATFSVGASASSTVAYQWLRNGLAITGATSSTYTLNSAAAGDDGAIFRCVVSDGAGFVNSSAVALTVGPATGPVAALVAPALTTGGASTYAFTVVYSDNVNIKANTLDNSDIRVSGPNGYDQPATLVTTGVADAKTLTVTYSAPAPAGTWGNGDSGTYTVKLQPNQVQDSSPAFFAGGTLGTFSVSIPKGGGLLAQYNFSESSGATTADDSGDGNSGTLVGGAKFVAGRSGAGNALSLTADGQYVSIPNSATLNPTSGITLSAWVNPTNWNGNPRLIQKGASDDQYRLLAESGAMTFDLAGVGVIAAPLPSTGVWHLITGTWDGSTMTLYVDGAQVASAAKTGTIAATSTPLVLGTKAAGATSANTLTGLLDDVRVYSRGLTAAEVQTLFSGSGGTTNHAPTVATSAAGNWSSGTPKNANLSALGADQDTGEGSLKYTWAMQSGPGTATFGANNGLNAGKSLAATVSQSGDYTFTVTISDPGGKTTTSTTPKVTVSQVETINVAPSQVTLPDSGTQTFTASAVDQFGKSFSPAPGSFNWAVTSGGVGGSVSSSGLYTAPASGTGADTVTATDAGTSVQGTATVNVSNNPPGLSGEYEFDESSGSTSADASGNGNTAAILGGASFGAANRGAGSGNALSLAGVAGQYARVADNTTLDPTSAITLSAWINVTDWNGNRRILQKGSNDNQYRLLAEGGVLKFDLTGVGTLTSTLPSAGVWHLVTATYNGTSETLYVDGTQVATAAHTGSVAKTTDPLVIGTKKVGDTNAGNAFKGSLDDVRIYTRSLSGAEVQALFGSGSNDQPPTVATAAAAGAFNAPGTGVTLTVLGADSDSGEPSLTYTWSVKSGPGTATFSDNKDNSAKSTVATVSVAGTYSFLATIRDPNGLSVTSQAGDVTFTSQEASIAVSPSNPSVVNGSTQAFTATALDQFKAALASQPTFAWSLASQPAPVGSIDPSTGIYTAPASGTGTDTVFATDTGTNVTGSTTVVVGAAAAGPVARYTFDESSGATSADASGNGNTAALFGGAAFTSANRNATAGNALSLAGVSGQYVKVSDNATLNPTSAITLSAWVNATDWNGNRRILQKGSNDNQYRLLAEGGLLKLDLTGVGTLTATLPSTGAWHLVTATYDGTNEVLYVDGVQVAKAARTGVIATTTTSLVIGAKNSAAATAGDDFKGSLDDLRVYSRALSAAEVAGLFSAG